MRDLKEHRDGNTFQFDFHCKVIERWIVTCKKFFYKYPIPAGPGFIVRVMDVLFTSILFWSSKDLDQLMV